MITIDISGPDKERAPLAKAIARDLKMGRHVVLHFSKPDAPAGEIPTGVTVVIRERRVSQSPA